MIDQLIANRSTPGVDIAILTRQRPHDLRRAIESVLRQLTPHDRLLVLENGCPDLSTERLRAAYESVTWLRSRVNLGVAGGRNSLAEAATAPIVLFLDDDAELMPPALSEIRTLFSNEPRLAVVAMGIQQPDSNRARRREVPSRSKSSAGKPFEATYFLGGACAIRREALDEVGGFDADLFYALEELEVSIRLLGRGWRIWYAPEIKIVHHASVDGRPSGREVFFNVRNRFRVVMRHLPWPNVISHLVIWNTYWLLRAASTGLLPDYVRGLGSGLREIPRSIRARTPIAKTTVDLLRTEHGRLWY